MNRIMWVALFFSGIIVGCATKKSLPDTKAAYKDVASFMEEKGIRIGHNHNMKLYAFIKEWYGVPHADNGCSKTGTDCSCFIQLLCKTVYGKDPGRSSAAMYKQTKSVSEKQLREGDFIFFRTKGNSVSHVGMYLQNNRFVHVSTSAGVVIHSLTDTYYTTRIVGFGRLP